MTLPSAALKAATPTQRILVGTATEEGILAYDFNPTDGTLHLVGNAAKLQHPIWLALSHDKKYLYAAQELEDFQGKKTGGVASFHQQSGTLTPISSENSSGPGTCQLALDHTGHVIVAVNYSGGSIASFTSTEGKLSGIVYSEHYKGSGPNKDRQEAAHAHFASYSPDNRFAYINDLGLDEIHIYHLHPDGQLTHAGAYHSHPGAGPRTLHFHPHLPVAYSINELDSTLDVLAWKSADGSLEKIEQHTLIDPSFKAETRACDLQFTRDGKFAYIANRFDDFLLSFSVDTSTGKLTKGKRSNCGGKIPRHFTLDPSERWMLVANQQSGNLSVFARNPKTGELADTGFNLPAPTPMCIVFV